MRNMSAVLDDGAALLEAGGISGEGDAEGAPILAAGVPALFRAAPPLDRDRDRIIPNNDALLDCNSVASDPLPSLETTPCDLEAGPRERLRTSCNIDELPGASDDDVDEPEGVTAPMSVVYARRFFGPRDNERIMRSRGDVGRDSEVSTSDAASSTESATQSPSTSPFGILQVKLGIWDGILGVCGSTSKVWASAEDRPLVKP